MVTEEIRKWLEHPPAVRGLRVVEDMFVIGTDIGKSRDENQDRVAVLKIGSPQRNGTSWCACVCDGMGGMKNGAEAASLALAAFFSSLISDRKMEPKSRLEAAAKSASEQVTKSVNGGGATLSAILIEDGSAFTINVGDSRIYRIRDSEDVQRLTVDDTLAEAFGAEDRGLLQYIGARTRISPHVHQIEPTSGQLVITSDGAHVVGDQLLNDLGKHSGNASQYCERVLDLANWMGGRDNASIIVIPRPLSTQSRALETSSDVSVWSVEGRLKIAWAAGRPDVPAAPELKAKNEQPSAEPVALSKDKTGEAAGGMRPKGKRSPKTKKDQIEIGFSDERAK